VGGKKEEEGADGITVGIARRCQLPSRTRLEGHVVVIEPTLEGMPTVAIGVATRMLTVALYRLPFFSLWHSGTMPTAVSIAPGRRRLNIFL
jgi:hypothetical protein